MEEISRLQVSRRGHKAHVTKVLKKANEVLNTETHTDRNIALASLNTALEQLTKKKDIIGELDAKIAAEIKDPKELEAEIFESDEINYDLEENISQIRKYIEISSLSSHTQELSPLATASSNPPQNTTQETLQENTTQEPSQEPMYEHPQQVASQENSQEHMQDNPHMSPPTTVNPNASPFTPQSPSNPSPIN
ncbi:Hypothetical predicted protein, partial [Paramuricea clavata]